MDNGSDLVHVMDEDVTERQPRGGRAAPSWGRGDEKDESGDEEEKVQDDDDDDEDEEQDIDHTAVLADVGGGEQATVEGMVTVENQHRQLQLMLDGNQEQILPDLTAGVVERANRGETAEDKRRRLERMLERDENKKPK
jgi:hypothetical protein